MQQTQTQQIQTLIFGDKTVTYVGKTYPTGSIACQALAIPDEVLTALLPLCCKIAPVNTLIKTQATDKGVLLAAGKAAHALFQLMGQYEPFTFMAQPEIHDRLDQVFTVDACKKIVPYYRKFSAQQIDDAAYERYSATADLILLTPAIANLYDALTTLQQKLGAFAAELDAADADCTQAAYLTTFNERFPADFRMGDGTDTWLSMNNVTVQYVAGKVPGGDKMQMLKHMHFVSFGGMLRADFFEGLAVGHAPKRCGNCGQWFLTTDARHTKYCGNVCPDDPKHRTCRQIAALKGREYRELADDHPLKAVYDTRMNSIDHSLRRGTLDAALGAEMKRLAKSKLERALSNSMYANGSYRDEMTQEALKNETLGQL